MTLCGMEPAEEAMTRSPFIWARCQECESLRAGDIEYFPFLKSMKGSSGDFYKFCNDDFVDRPWEQTPYREESDYLEGGRRDASDYLEAVSKVYTRLGSTFYLAKGIPQNLPEALKWFKKAADMQNDVAQCYLGHFYDQGIGVPQDIKAAVKWFGLAANLGNAEAQYFISECHAHGRGLSRNRILAASWCFLSAKKGFSKAKLNLGNYFNELSHDTRYLRIVARQGHSGAQFKLGIFHESRSKRFMSYPDTTFGRLQLAKAVEWYLLAAEQGHAQAQYNLGIIFWSVAGIEPDHDKAMSWLRKAALQGHEAAEVKLREFYGSPEDLH